MALLKCKLCRKAFISGLQEEVVCPDCDARLRELFPSVRNFLRNNHGRVYTAQEISDMTGIALEDVVVMVSMGLIGLSINSKATNGR